MAIEGSLYLVTPCGESQAGKICNSVSDLSSPHSGSLLPERMFRNHCSLQEWRRKIGGGVFLHPKRNKHEFVH